MWTVGSWCVLCHIPSNHSKREHGCHLAGGTLCMGRGLPTREGRSGFPLAFLTTIAWWPLGPRISDESFGLSASHQGEH